MAFQQVFTDGGEFPWPTGKVVCVGRNYAEHARELNNDIPAQPLLFIKPATAIVAFTSSVTIPSRFRNPHYETEMSVLIGKQLNCCNRDEARTAIVGLGVGLDLTLRELQGELKRQGHPWERAKAFDGSCVLSPFAPFSADMDLQNIGIRLVKNNQLVQDGTTRQMLFPVIELLCEISTVFTLEPGDVVMTGTPSGVGQLNDGDLLQAELDNLVSVHSTVKFK